MNEYEQDLHIDESALDIEWLRQPELMLKYTDLQARAKKEVARLKEKVLVVAAEITKAVREDPESYGLDKVTEKGIESVVASEKEYREVLKEQREAQYELDMLYGATTAVDHRRSALENMVKLLGQQYYAGPKAPRNIGHERQAREALQKEVDKKISFGKRRRRKS